MNDDALPELTWVRDLEAFEGPILSEYTDADGVQYLEKWCSYVDGAVRYLVVRSHRAAINAYLDRTISMLALLTASDDDAGWIVDCIGEDARETKRVRVSELPHKYLPQPTAMHDEDLRPVGFER